MTITRTYFCVTDYRADIYFTFNRFNLTWRQIRGHIKVLRIPTETDIFLHRHGINIARIFSG
jgi:hypothetical protein